MAIVVEDGTGKANAVSYISYSDASTYHTTYGNTDWTTSSSEGEAALVRATAALDLQYGSLYLSYVLTNTQSLLFPRYTFWDNHGRYVDSNQIPKAIKDAVCELALLDILGESIYPEDDPSSYAIEEHIKVDAIETTRKFSQPVNRTTNGKVNSILFPILRNKKNFGIVR